jgi:2-polyprenyl-3-methyl-5-hydroxy-6-metoxy-1,4-benzoquinol methylase
MKFYKKVFPDFHTSLLVKELRGCYSILDLGCGKSSVVKFVNATYKVGVDLFKPYIKESRKNKIHHEYVLGDITKLEIKPKSFDAVIALDVIEHLNKKDGLNLIKKYGKMG